MTAAFVAELVWYSPRLWPLALSVAIAIVAITLYLYAPQVRLLGRPWRWLLPGLRATALLALAASILKPVTIRQRTDAEAGAVIFLVDRSRSMAVHDLAMLPDNIARKRDMTRSAAQLVTLGDALGMLPPGARAGSFAGAQAGASRLSQLVDDVARARSELEYAGVAGRGSDPAKLRLAQSLDAFKAAAAEEAASADRGPTARRLHDVATNLKKVAALTEADCAAAGPRYKAALDAVDAFARAAAAAGTAADRDLYRNDPAVRAACDALATTSRFDRVESALTREGGLLSRFPASVPLYGFAFADDVAALPLRGGGRPIKKLLVTPDGPRTDLTGALAAAIDRVRGAPLRAVVILSDGRQVGGDPTIASAAAAGINGAAVPVFAVYAAARVPLDDVAVSRLSVPSGAFVGETITVRAEIASHGYKAAVANVTCTFDDGPSQTKPVGLPDDPQNPAEVVPPARVEFNLRVNQPGVHHIVVSVPPQPGEAGDDNNRLERWVKVMADKVRVAAVAGPAGRDFQFVRNALARTPWVQLDAAVLDAGGAGGQLPLTPEQIESEDLLMLFDVPVNGLSDLQWDAVYKLVTERGGSAILVAGDDHLPAEYAATKITAGLLPYRPDLRPAWRVWPGKEPYFHLAPAPGAETVDALRLADNAADSLNRWAQLPPFFRFLPAPELKPNARPLLVERDSSSPVLVEGRLGLGRTFFFGADETWRWRYKIGERDQDRFWLQLVRYAAEEPYAAHGGSGAALDADRVAIEPGQSVHLRGKIKNPDGSASTVANQSVDLLKGDAVVRTTTLAAAGPAGLGRYAGTLADVPAGDYQLRLTSPGGDAAVLPLHVAPSFEAETADLAGADQPMRRLADGSGGAFLPLESVNSLPDRIRQAQSESARFVEKPLWDSYYLFLFVLACFALEWALRKRLGLV